LSERSITKTDAETFALELFACKAYKAILLFVIVFLFDFKHILNV